MKNILVYFGAGEMGVDALNHFKYNTYDTVLFCDNSEQKIGTKIENIMVVSINTIKELTEWNKVDIVISSGEWEDIFFQCYINGLEENIRGIYDPFYKKIQKYSQLYANINYSQDGEEVFLKYFFMGKKKGVYVDVGAHHPIRFSNTYWAYQMGWTGINIEPNYENYLKFKYFRPFDINLNCGISDKNGKMKYYMFEESALNTFCKEEIKQENVVKQIKEIDIRRLDDIFEEYQLDVIDYLDIDVEGLELQVLKSNNWKKYKPTVILCEQKIDFEKIMESDIYKYLKDIGYRGVSKFNRTMIYVRK